MIVIKKFDMLYDMIRISISLRRVRKKKNSVIIVIKKKRGVDKKNDGIR